MPGDSPVVVDGQLSNEKISELLALGTEYEELEFKSSLDVSYRPGKVFLARHVGAMQVLGGYILIGADDNGRLTGDMDEIDTQPFDSANLKPAMLRYLPRPLNLHSTVLERSNPGEEDQHVVVAVFIGPHPTGCAVFISDGAFRDGNGDERKLFSMGDVYWRDGTSTTRLSHEGLEVVIASQIETAKQGWVTEQVAIRRQEQDDLALAQRGREAANGPLGAINLDMPSRELSLTALDLVRRGDEIALRHLLVSGEARARTLIDRDDLDNLSATLDKLVCLAATFMEYEVENWFDAVLELLVRIYGMPVTEDQARLYGHRTNIPPEDVGPRVWLQIIERAVALGGLAVRRKRWNVVRSLTIQLPPVLADDYNRNWLRHGLTMASRARHFERDNEQLSLLTLARNRAMENDCLRPDGIDPDDEALLTSLAQFDFLSNVVALDASPGVDGLRVFYPSFARFYQQRIQGTAERLLTDPDLRAGLIEHDDEYLAGALQVLEGVAQGEGWRYDGFHGFGGTPVGEFIEHHAARG